MNSISKIFIAVILMTTFSATFIFGQVTKDSKFHKSGSTDLKKADLQLEANLKMYESTWNDIVNNGNFTRVIDGHEYFNLKDIQLHDKSNNQVLSTLRYEAKVKHNGELYNAQAAHLWTLNDEGKVIAFQQYVDTKKLADTSHE